MMTDDEMKQVLGYVPTFEIDDEEWEKMKARNEASLEKENKQENVNDSNP
jgi:hypothetical protein